MHAARIEQSEHGKVPADDGWFVLNLADMAWATVPGGGTWSVFESPHARSSLLGIGVHILHPGETPGLYHAEPDQEGFLVLFGECLAVIEGEEQMLRAWDYFHCPPGTAHITVGAGDGACALLMVGTRTQPGPTRYNADAIAARHGAAVARDTEDPAEAYAGRPPVTPVASAWPVSTDR